MKAIKHGSTDQSIEVRFFSSTTFLPLTGLDHASAGLTLGYRRTGGSLTSITPASLAAPNSAHADGGFEELANGWYRLDLPDAAVASGADAVVVYGTVTGGVMVSPSIALVAYDPQAVAVGALQPTTAGRTLDVTSGGCAGIDWANVEAPTTTLGLTGTTISTSQVVASVTATVAANVTQFGGTNGTFSAGRAEVNTTHWAGTAVGSANVRANVTQFGGSNGTFTGGRPEVNATHWGGTAVASAIVSANAVQISGDSVAADNLEAACDGTGFNVGNGSIVAASVTAGVTVSTNNDKTDYSLATAPPTAAAIADAVWDEAQSGHTTAGTFGKYLDTEVSGISGGGGGTDWTADERTAIRAILGIPGSGTTPADPTTGILDTIRDAVVVVDGIVDDILVDTAQIGAAGAGLTAVPWNAAWDSEVQSEVQDAIEANHLDHLLAVDYDPASKPGVATALLNELVRSDAGVSQFTANALELAPGGGGSSVTVTPLSSSVSQRANGTTIEMFVGETCSVGPIAITDSTGAAVDLSGKTLQVVIEGVGVDVAVVASGDITVSGADSNQITFNAPAAATTKGTNARTWSLRDTADGNRVLARGNWKLLEAAKADA